MRARYSPPQTASAFQDTPVKKAPRQARWIKKKGMEEIQSSCSSAGGSLRTLPVVVSIIRLLGQPKRLRIIPHHRLRPVIGVSRTRRLEAADPVAEGRGGVQRSEIRVR